MSSGDERLKPLAQRQEIQEIDKGGYRNQEE